jgi:hypothetical protein
MTADERRNYLYREVGECIHSAQSLELFLAAMISTLNKKLETPIDAEGLVIPHYKDTLGQLLAQLRRIVTIDASGERVLSDALTSRNYVAHHFFNRNANAFGFEEVFEATKTELAKHGKQIAMGLAILIGWYQVLRKAYGLEGETLLIEQDYNLSEPVH